MKTLPATAYYVYGFTLSGIAPEVNLGVGIDEQHAPFIWTCGEISAVLSMVVPEDFSGPEGEENMGSLDWLGPRACRHQAAIERVMHIRPVLPARFGTLFSSLELLEKFLSGNTQAIVRFLERINDWDEWALKGFLRPADAEARMLSRLQSQEGKSEGMSPGAAYLWEQRLLIKARRALIEWVAEVNEGLIGKLEAIAVESCQLRILPRDAVENGRDMILNLAFLVPRPALAAFRAHIEQASGEHNPDGLTFELSGPWPPYSFCPALESEQPLAANRDA